MNRRHFIALSALAGLAPAAASYSAETGSVSGRDLFELRQILIDTEEQKTGFGKFMEEACIPALNRAGVQPVGVFYPQQGLSPIYLLTRYKSFETYLTIMSKLAADADLLQKGAAFVEAPASAPAYKRMETSLLLAFTGMPELETPIKKAGRVFQLRIYESPSVATGQKKIEMFNKGEIAIFREAGLHPVFFGEAIAGAKLPNLTYLLVFESMDEQKANWKKFGDHPEWKRMRAMPEYADKKILSNITNLLLVPAKYSQI